MKIYKSTISEKYVSEKNEEGGWKAVMACKGSRWVLFNGRENGVELERSGIGAIPETIYVDKSSFKNNFELDEIGCDSCDDRMIDEVYEYEGRELCFDCLIREAGIETETVTNYYIDGYYLGDNLDKEPLSNELKNQLEVKVIKLEEE